MAETIRPSKSIVTHIEDGLCYLSLGLLALLPLAETIARTFFKTGVPDSSNLMIHLLLLVGILSGMITTREREHISIAITENFLSEKYRRPVQIWNSLLSALILGVVAFCAPSFIRLGLRGTMIGFIPDRVIALILPIGYLVMAQRFNRQARSLGAPRILSVLVPLAALVLSFPALAKFIWGLDTPDWAFELGITLEYIARIGRAPVILVLVISALLGTPLFAIMGGLAVILISASGGEMDVVITKIYSSLTQNSMIAIPLFALTGFFLSESKAGERLVETFKSLFGWIPGGMIIVSVLICAFFTSFTGASGVTILALGGILYSILSENAPYPPQFSMGLLTSVGGIGLLFPPSLPIILVGTTTQTNIIHMFLGGLIPGIILAAALIIYGIGATGKIKIPRQKLEPRKAGASLRKYLWEILFALLLLTLRLGSLISNTTVILLMVLYFFVAGVMFHRALSWEILLPFILIAGYFTGTLSLVEIGAVAVVYTFFIEVFIFRDIKLSELRRVFAKSVPVIGGVLSILALSQALSYYIVDTRLPEFLARWMYGAIQSKFLFLLLLNLALLVVGCLMDIFSAILVVLPLISPLGAAYGIDPVHLGIIFLINLEVGFLTPPVGMNLFLAKYRFNKPFIEICRNVLPFLLIQLVVVALVTYVPILSTFLKDLFP